MNKCHVPACTSWDTVEHHIVSKGAGGSDEPFNKMWLCFYHHIQEFHQKGWRWFCRKHPELEQEILTARERQGKKI
jgi:hypothetical protein